MDPGGGIMGSNAMGIMADAMGTMDGPMDPGTGIICPEGVMGPMDGPMDPGGIMDPKVPGIPGIDGGAMHPMGDIMGPEGPGVPGDIWSSSEDAASVAEGIIGLEVSDGSSGPEFPEGISVSGSKFPGIPDIGGSDSAIISEGGTAPDC
jgi:hypothetical protein